MRRASELLIGLLLLAVLLRMFVVQGLLVPVQVSAGSMAPAWLGPHREFRCDHCRFTFRCGIDRLPSDGKTICPNCQHNGPEYDSRPLLAGDALVIDRAAFDVRRPRRWEVAVFRCPDNAANYCIKRIVGLPGESIQIRHGDLFIDGQILRKKLAAQRLCRLLVHDSEFFYDESDASTPQWKPSPPWQFDADRKAFQLAARAGRGNDYAFDEDVQEADVRQEKKTVWLRFHPGSHRGVTDDYAYNHGEVRSLALVRDLMITGTIVAEEADNSSRDGGVENAEFFLEARDDETAYTVVMQLHGYATALRIDGETVDASISLHQVQYPDRFDFEFSTFDRQILLAINGRVVLQHPIDSASQQALSLALGASYGNCEVSKLKVWRDIYYTHPGPGRGRWGLDEPYSIAEGEYFMLGDNSPISDDSRTSAAGSVRRDLLIGKPIVFPAR